MSIISLSKKSGKIFPGKGTEEKFTDIINHSLNGMENSARNASYHSTEKFFKNPDLINWILNISKNTPETSSPLQLIKNLFSQFSDSDKITPGFMKIKNIKTFLRLLSGKNTLNQWIEIKQDVLNDKNITVLIPKKIVNALKSTSKEQLVENISIERKDTSGKIVKSKSPGRRNGKPSSDVEKANLPMSPKGQFSKNTSLGKIPLAKKISSEKNSLTETILAGKAIDIPVLIINRGKSEIRISPDIQPEKQLKDVNSFGVNIHKSVQLKENAESGTIHSGRISSFTIKKRDIEKSDSNKTNPISEVFADKVNIERADFIPSNPSGNLNIYSAEAEVEHPDFAFTNLSEGISYEKPENQLNFATDRKVAGESFIPVNSSGNKVIISHNSGPENLLRNVPEIADIVIQSSGDKVGNSGNPDIKNRSFRNSFPIAGNITESQAFSHQMRPAYKFAEPVKVYDDIPREIADSLTASTISEELKTKVRKPQLQKLSDINHDNSLPLNKLSGNISIFHQRQSIPEKIPFSINMLLADKGFHRNMGIKNIEITTLQTIHKDEIFNNEETQSYPGKTIHYLKKNAGKGKTIPDTQPGYNNQDISDKQVRSGINFRNVSPLIQNQFQHFGKRFNATNEAVATLRTLPENLSENISSMIIDKTQYTRINLTPRSLGPVQISLKFHADEVSARILVQSQEVQHVIEKQIQKISGIIENAHLKVKQIEVVLTYPHQSQNNASESRQENPGLSYYSEQENSSENNHDDQQYDHGWFEKSPQLEVEELPEQDFFSFFSA